MKSLEEFNIELKRAEDYLNAMVRAKTANREDCENVKMHLDNINSIVRNLSIPLVSNCDDIFEEASKCDIIEDECPNCGSNSVGVAFGMNECFNCQYEWA